jgi:dienelactone hydrolase
VSRKFDVDERVNASWPGFEKGLKAAELAWTRTVEFFDKHLKPDG